MSKKSILFAIALLVSSLFGAASVPAQSQDQTAAPAATQNASPSSDSVESADLAITATVTARELRFETVPNPTVEFTGSHERHTVWEAERQNLPRPVEPGVTYRDIGIRLKITSRFADIDRIVAEALGEVPTSDVDAPPRENAPPEPAPSPSSPPTSQPQGGTP